MFNCVGSCCFHNFRGPIWMVVPDGHVVQKCCKCSNTRVIHIDHLHDDCSRSKHWDRVNDFNQKPYKRNKKNWPDIMCHV